MPNAPLTFDEAKAFLPPALSQSDLKELYSHLRDLDKGIRYFSPHDFPFHLQGDAFDGAPYPVVTKENLSERFTRVMVLSNTCDIAPDNPRNAPANVTVAPISRVSAWRSGMSKHGMSEDAIENSLQAARSHRVSYLFYLPAGRGLDEESLVLLDCIQSLPLSRFEAASPVRLVTLSQPSFWLLLVKLSIHFCRQHEGVARQAA